MFWLTLCLFGLTHGTRLKISLPGALFGVRSFWSRSSVWSRSVGTCACSSGPRVTKRTSFRRLLPFEGGVPLISWASPDKAASRLTCANAYTGQKAKPPHRADAFSSQLCGGASRDAVWCFCCLSCQKQHSWHKTRATICPNPNLRHVSGLRPRHLSLGLPGPSGM